MLNEFWGGQINEFRFSSTRLSTNFNQRAISGDFNQFEYLMRHFYYRNSWALKPQQRSVMNNAIHSTLSCFVLPLCEGSKLAPINFRFHKTLSQRNVWRRNTKEFFFLLGLMNGIRFTMQTVVINANKNSHQNSSDVSIYTEKGLRNRKLGRNGFVALDG